MNDALSSALSNVPSVARIFLLFRHADARAAAAVPHHRMAVGVVRAVMRQVADTCALVKVEMVVIVVTHLLDTDASAVDDVPFLTLVVAVTHFVMTRAVEIAITFVPVDELSSWAEDEVAGLRVSTRFEDTCHACYEVLGLSKSCVCANLLFHRFEGEARSRHQGSNQWSCCQS